ncbi:hypothetical protein V3F56_02910 [Moorellaceae bacterium AZ2]
MKRIVRFLKDESGYTIQALVWDIIAGLGASAIAFGLLAANRIQGGAVADDMRAIITPSQLPDATEQITQLYAGYTGAITEMTVQ